MLMETDSQPTMPELWLSYYCTAINHPSKPPKGGHMAHHTMTFVFEASSGLTQSRRFKGVTLGEPGGLDPQAGD
jgi:hypothetical protein